ncbi:MAG: hypothetical protein SCALA701_35240 [Candidatus Scalindua sp.]|nr:DUF2092 domain-containing protein [Planctomycetota bacterium]GJQ60723.1 MAG: hypothetical protein SCALA701_35240 [Candidatus Scalindua sp.]
MKHRFFFFVFILLSLSMGNHAFSYEQEGASSIDPTVDKTLRQMCDYLKSAEQYTLCSQATFEKISVSGQKLEYGETVSVAVRRPDRLHANIVGDLINNRFWYNGKSITMLDTDLNMYATTDAPADIDSTLGFAAKSLGITAPLADFVVSDPYTALTEKAQSATYVGLHKIGGIKCHHLAFTQENLDWQIWIEDGKMQVPRKIVITYKLAEGAPQYTAVLSDWNFAPHLPESVFAFIAPADSEKIEFMPVENRVPDKID